MVDRGPVNPLSQLRRGVLEYCVLSLLSRGGQLYGFDIVRRLADVEALVTSEGTIYPLLSRLRRDGWVTTSWAESASGPPRRYYSITAAGRGDGVVAPGGSARRLGPRGRHPPVAAEAGEQGVDRPLARHQGLHVGEPSDDVEPVELAAPGQQGEDAVFEHPSPKL